MTTKKRKPLFERLKQGLEEGIAHAKGEQELKTIEYPDKPPQIDAKTLVDLRRLAEMSQAYFAQVLSVSTKTVQSWEQGEREPSEANRRLLQLFSLNPEAFCQSVGIPVVSLPGVQIKVLKSGERKIVLEKNRDKKVVT